MAMFTRIFEYYDMKPEIDDKPEAKELANAKGDIVFDHVDFTYDGERMILKDINFTLRSGDCVAIVGPSGSGKSTIVNLIPRLWDPQEGSVTFDGTDVRDLTLHSLRSQVGVVTQETYLFNSTIRENLLYAKPDATEEEMIDACKKANIYDFISNQPDGLDTMVGNRGLKLSGGEKQRISIARAILKDAPIIILDEATANVDPENEDKLIAAFDALTANKTVIMIAHRLKTIRNADQIVVFDGGKIACGTHEELLKGNKKYSHFIQLREEAASWKMQTA
jgi:ATP-binding cassette subfamily B protein